MVVATTSVAVDGFDVAVGGWWRDLGSMVAVIRRGREENPRSPSSKVLNSKDMKPN
ncbi:hypothetical protein DEO72_LG10g496 [Vigna unguiculata]|uniref:Uncharacterized protein n=1 Tax=Vigna unguiculata TaxID=3917 RepID=A0A4D6NBG4_VIGUN|nr:hypothetical protein DEO72_LG10g496 [Vigna unguiculata]